MAEDIAEQLIQHYESCVLHPYEDARGIPTIGWGNTVYQDNTRVTMNDRTLSQSEADTLFMYWLKDFTAKVSVHVPGAKDNELGAFVSLAYNIGITAFTGSTALRQWLRANKKATGDAIELWNKAGNHVLKGLQRRRRAERLVFDGSDVGHAIVQAEVDFP